MCRYRCRYRSCICKLCSYIQWSYQTWGCVDIDTLDVNVFISSNWIKRKLLNLRMCRYCRYHCRIVNYVHKWVPEVYMKYCSWFRLIRTLKSIFKIFCSILYKVLIVGSSAPFHLGFGILRFRINIWHFITAFR